MRGWFLVCMTVLLWQSVQSNADKPAVKLKAGDRIVFLGDSITQAGAGPNAYVAMILNPASNRFVAMAMLKAVDPK